MGYEQPYVVPSCPRQCKTGFTLDYKLYCMCPILYFVLPAEYVHHLPHFNANFYSGHLANIDELTDVNITDSTVIPLLRPTRKVGWVGVLLQVLLLFYFIFNSVSIL